MTADEAAEVQAAFAKVLSYARRQHDAAIEMVQAFQMLTKAIQPVVVACEDEEVLVKFRDAMVAIDAAVSVVASEDEGVLH